MYDISMYIYRAIQIIRKRIESGLHMLALDRTSQSKKLPAKPANSSISKVPPHMCARLRIFEGNGPIQLDMQNTDSYENSGEQ